MSSPCSLKDIARECGLSVSTVSQILKNSPRDYSSEQTRAKVRETAQRLGYRTNYGYRLMRGQKTMTVAILLSFDHMRSEERISKLIIELIGCFNSRGYASYFNSLSYDAAENLNIVRDLLARGVECFVSIGTPFGCGELEKEIEERGGYLIGTERDLRNYIYLDAAQASFRLIEHLREKAGDDFCFFYCDPLPKNRFAALRRHFRGMSMEEITQRYTCKCRSALECREDYADFAFAAGYAATESACGKNPDLRAFFYQNDAYALGGIAWLMRNGREIGRDVFVAGHNNDTAVRNAPYPVSSADHEWKRHAPLFVEKTLKHEPCRLVLPTTPHIREYVPGTRRIREIIFDDFEVKFPKVHESFYTEK